MSLLWLLAALALLVSGVLLVLLRRSPCKRAQEVRLRLDRRIVALLLRLAHSPADSQDLDALQQSARALLKHLIKLKRALRQLPPLPASPDAEPRLMDLARDVADGEHINTDAMLHALTEDAACQPDTQEIAAFPLLVAVAQCQRFGAVLKILSADEAERRSAKRLAVALHRKCDQDKLLSKTLLNSIGLAALVEELRNHQEDQLLAAVTSWLTVRGICIDTLSQCYTNRQVRLAEEIRRTLVCLDTLEKLNWLPRCHQADPLHAVLMLDPAGVYPRMHDESQLQLRLRVTQLGRAAKAGAADIARNALHLSQETDEQSADHYIGHWFETPEDLTALHRTLGTRKGRLAFRLSPYREALEQAFLWCFGIGTSLIFLQAGHPVFMLPFFALAAGCFSRYLLSLLPPATLPGMVVDAAANDIRTLVVLHATFRDQHDAIQAARQLKKLRQIFHEEAADFLLLGDFAPCMTAVSGLDGGIIQAITAAFQALGDDPRLLYLQRGRIWDSGMHKYCAHNGLSGALIDVCRLIARGEHADPIAFTTTVPPAFERKYAYILSIPTGCQPSPDMLQKLLSVIAHPQCQRYAEPGAQRGYSILLPEETPHFMGVGLLRPDAFLEATDGMIPHRDSLALCGVLAGQHPVRGAHAQLPQEESIWANAYQQALSAWRQLPWQLSWVQTPTGFVRNPLRLAERFRLREQLRGMLIPLGQFLLLVWAILTHSWPLLLVALAAPELHCFREDKPILRMLSRLTLLPARMGVNLGALVQLLRKKADAPPDWTVLLLWMQLLSATLVGALGFVPAAFLLPAISLAILFLFFPLAQNVLSAADPPPAELDEQQLSLLEDIAAASWQFFLTHVNGEHPALPPCTVQFDPPLGPEAATSPEAIGAYLLSCVCAKEMGYLSAPEAAARIDRTVTAAATLPMPFGMPCRRYALPALTVLDSHTDAGGTGLMLAALLTTAQALRTWLPELPPALLNLSARVQDLVEAFDVSALYDGDSGCFHATLDEAGQGSGHVDLFSDEALLLSVAACAMRRVPAEHLTRLRRPYTRLDKTNVPLSRHGTASAHLLAGLLLPLDHQDTLAYIHAAQSRGSHGLFGQDASRYAAFSPDMRYKQGMFGIPDISLCPGITSPVYAPHAAAMCLPFCPNEAAAALAQFHALKCLQADGFCDAIDLSDGTALIGLQDALHQGVTLIAAAHVLARRSIRSYFCSLPEVEACLPLLQRRQPRLILPTLPVHRTLQSACEQAAQHISPQQSPAAIQIIGSSDFRLLIGSDGSSAMFDGSTPLTRSSSPRTAPVGLQLYLADEGCVYRLCSPHADSLTFSPGEFRCEQTFGHLRTELRCTVDPVRKQALHHVTVTNLTGTEIVFDLSDILLPDLGISPLSLLPSRPEHSTLSMHVQGTDKKLHHSVSCSQPPVSISACTDATAFLGRSGTLHHPASLYEPPFDLLTATPEPCLSFRVRMTLPARDQVHICFATSLKTAAAPQPNAFEGICRLAALQHAALLEVAGLTSRQAQIASRLTGALLSAGLTWMLTLTADDSPDSLRDAIAVTSWYHMVGLPVQLTVICTDEQADFIREMLCSSPAKEAIYLTSANQAPENLPQIRLHGHQPLEDQMDALYGIIEQPFDRFHPPKPALLPRKQLLHTSTYGGFEPDTKAYIIELESRQTTPAPWENHHITRYYSETVDEPGFREPFHEQVWLETEDHTLLTPWSVELPRAVRISPGETSWEAWSDQLDIRLTAACMPGHRCALRLLKLRNAADMPVTITVHVLADLCAADSPLECSQSMITPVAQTSPQRSFIAGDGWETSRVSKNKYASFTDLPCLHMPDSAHGNTAHLTCRLQLEPGSSGKCTWLAGYARSKADITHALTALHANRISDLLRSSRAIWDRHLTSLRTFTPEDTLTTLLNDILPIQTFFCTGLNAIPALACLHPMRGLRRLLTAARKAKTPDDWAVLSLMLSHFIRITRKSSVAHVYLPHRKETLLNCCIQALLTIPLDEHCLPEGKDRARSCFLYALAAERLFQMSHDQALFDLHRKLLKAADTYLWQDSFYGPTLRLDVQCLACQVFGATPRTHQAMRTCWSVLYDQPHGLLRRQLPGEDAILPGYPYNGGMVTSDAVLALHALLTIAMDNEAFELLQTLNPLHHTDDALRMEVFRCAPYRLHGGMQASPLEAGRAFPDDGDDAASLLYAVTLHDILGVRREGNFLRILPHVPPEWDEFSITLQEGASTWRIYAERRISRITLDGLEIDSDHIRLHDDGKIHEVHFPLT